MIVLWNTRKYCTVWTSWSLFYSSQMFCTFGMKLAHPRLHPSGSTYTVGMGALKVWKQYYMEFCLYYSIAVEDQYKLLMTKRIKAVGVSWLQWLQASYFMVNCLITLLFAGSEQCGIVHRGSKPGCLAQAVILVFVVGCCWCICSWSRVVHILLLEDVWRNINLKRDWKQ